MYHFESKLLPGETILYKGTGTPKKGNRSPAAIIVLLVFAVVVQAVLIWSVKYEGGEGKSGIGFTWAFFFGVMVIFELLAIYNAFHLYFLKDRIAKKSEYCLTNQRAMVYDTKKDYLVYGYLREYTVVATSHEKGKYGDLYMNIGYTDESGNISFDKIKRIWFQKDSQNMAALTFLCVEQPKKLKKMVKEAKEKLN